MNGGGEDGRLTGMKRGEGEKQAPASQPHFSYQTTSRITASYTMASHQRRRHTRVATHT